MKLQELDKYIINTETETNPSINSSLVLVMGELNSTELKNHLLSKQIN
jgi:hypothetical protein